MDPERAEGIDISRHYDGAWHTRKGRSYRNPLSQDVGRERPIHVEDGFYHRDYLLRVTQMSQDLARYISPSYAKPFHLIVQATSRAFQEPQGEWRRAHLRGHAPTVVRLSVWAVGDLSDTRPKSNDEIALMWLKVLLILPAEIPLVLRGPLSKIPVLGSLLQPFLSSRGRMSDAYPIFFSRSWDYPKYPRNILDASPNHNRHHFNRQFATPPPAGIANDRVARQQAPARERVQENTQLGVPYDRSGDLERLIKPRKLMIQQSNREWRLSAGTSDSYIVISYASAHFPIDPHTGTCPRIERVAEQMAARSKCKAYWVAYRCMASPDDVKELTKDVHRMCDVFRGARQVYVLIPEITLENKRFWGTRMWCLPEALLCSTQTIVFCSTDGATEECTNLTGGATEECSKIQLAAEVWDDGEKTTRLLAEHFMGLLTLSRLELISLGLEALSHRRAPRSEFHQADLAFALMSLLRYRPRMDPEATLFQTLARLSLANDSDRIVERAVCLLPDPFVQHHSGFVLDDALGARLWDIEPLCQVAGVGENNEVFLDGCQSASIRWKDVPRIYFHGRTTWKKRLVEAGWQTAPVWFLFGLVLVWAGGKSAESIVPGTFILLFGLGMLLRLPWEIQRIHSGKVWGTTPWLIGFEGVLPIRQIERTFFGNYHGRLKYAPSSGLYREPDEDERLGRSPPWTEDLDLRNAPNLPPNHRWFTLVDTGPSMHVHVFSARMPPSVALICGKEGGMLRVVLCSYEANGNLLRKETVLRMETPMLSLTKTQSWIRLSQGWDTELDLRERANGEYVRREHARRGHR